MASDPSLIYQFQENGIEAKVFFPKEELDVQTIKQIKAMVKHPGMNHVRVMPDCHYARGCCVGFTSQLGDKIVPGYVGGDIGCGILTFPIGDLLERKKLEKIENKIRQAIPMGSGGKGGTVFTKKVATDADIRWLLSEADTEARWFAEAYKKQFGVDLKEYRPKYKEKGYLENLCLKIKYGYEYLLQSLGTLGGGNHFVEINEESSDEEEQLPTNEEKLPTGAYFTVHSGSRGLGIAICKYHQDKINTNCHFDYKTYERELKKIRRIVKHNPKELKKQDDELRAKLEAERHAKYLEGPEAYEYYFDMILAQKYAQLNRRIMLRRFLKQVNLDHLFIGPYENDQHQITNFLEENLIESIHNYIDFNDFVMRKGAISAQYGNKCIVSLNMRDGILICQGLGNEDWNWSSAHGSGRLLNRQQAGRLNLKRFQEEMKNVYSTSVVKETLDESPMAYKDTELIKKALENSVKILAHLKPVINVKATT